MGNAVSQKMLSVQTFANACELAPWVASVSGVGGDTESLSDQWLMTLKPNSVVYNGVPLQQVFLKIVPEHVSHPNPTTTIVLNGLQREIFIYANIIKPILDQNICPFFLPVLNVSYNCSAAALIAMLSAQGSSEQFNPEQVFLRNMTSIVYGVLEGSGRCFLLEKEPNQGQGLKKFVTGEPTAQVQAPENRQCVAEHVKNILETQQYTLLVTKAITSNITAADYVVSMWGTGKLDELHLFYFQFSIGYMVMLLKQIKHNDLHFGNVMIEKLPRPEKVVYGIDNMVYVYETDSIPLIFDFDRAKAPQLGDLYGDEVETFIECMTDYWCFFCALYCNNKDPVIPECLFRPENFTTAKALWDTTFAKGLQGKSDFMEVGLTILDGLKYVKDFQDIIMAFASSANVVEAYELDDSGLPSIRENAQFIYYIPFSLINSGDATVHVTDDVGTQLHLALNSDAVQLTVEDPEIIIQKKQLLARNKLKLLHLQLELEKNK